MNLPAQIRTETELEDVLARLSEADVEFARRLDGDVLIVGAGGKMGPSLARRVYRALGRVGSRCRVIAASRFCSAEARGRLEADDIQTLACDLLEPAQIAALPRAENVLFLAGRKFGTLDRTDLTWVTNTVVPAHVAEHFARSRLVVFSTGMCIRSCRSTGQPREKVIHRRRSANTRSPALAVNESSSSCRTNEPRHHFCTD